MIYCTLLCTVIGELGKDKTYHTAGEGHRKIVTNDWPSSQTKTMKDSSPLLLSLECML